ncbi:hypothetical protein IGI47_002794 [Enterococcus sp. AZ191]|uniref:hypothetical protein n=1 Tax=Enterococcus sp. AZ191 TaxID=2774639 RepID=UPI003F203556
MQNLKEKVMNASFKTRLFVTGAVASVSTLGPAVFADESVSAGARAVRSASTDAVTATLTEIKTGATEVISGGLPILLSVGGVIAVAFATVKIAKRFFGKAV